MEFPKVVDIAKVGEYESIAFAGAGYFYDEVLEYRVWCYPYEGAKDIFEGDDYFYAFEDYESALAFSLEQNGRQKPIALIKQYEWINEFEPGKYLHEKGERLAEWNTEHLFGRKRKDDSIINKLLELRP
jgi:putative acetyltransferase